MRPFRIIALFAAVAGLSQSTFADNSQDANFALTVIANSGVNDATGMCWATDGSNTLFVTEKGGRIRVVINGSIQATDFAMVSPVYTGSECGLDNVVVDPNYAANKYIYVFVSETGSLQRIYRYTAGMSGGNLIGSGKQQIGPDLPTAGQNHDGSGLAIGPDGYIYWGVGNLGNNSGPANGGTGVDGGSDEYTSYASKICRMDRFTGNAIPGGPFGTATTVRSYMFARGARNPFGLRFNPVNSTLWLTAVGDGYEQIFLIPPGGNIGWPTENNTSTTNGKLIPKFAYVTNPQPPLPPVVYGGCCTRGIFYNGTVFPAAYQKNLFWCDYNSGQIMRSILNGAGDTITSTSIFVTGTGGIVDISVGPDGALYYVTRGNGNVNRLYYAGPTQNINVSTSALTINEGATGTFMVNLATQPAGNVTVNIARSSGNTNISAAPATLTFTNANWNVNQPVTVTSVSTPDGVNDAATITASSAGLTSQNVQITATDTAVANAPTAKIVSPVNSATVSGTNADFYGTGTPKGSATMVKAEFYIDGVLGYTDPFVPGPGAHFHWMSNHATWDTTQLTNGVHTLRMTVYDSNGLTGSDQITVTVANTGAPPPPPPPTPAPTSTSSTASSKRCGCASIPAEMPWKTALGVALLVGCIAIRRR